MTQIKVTLELFNVLRLNGAPDKSALENVLARLDLNDKDLKKLYAILADAKIKAVLGRVSSERIDHIQQWENKRVGAIGGLVALRRFFKPIWINSNKPDAVADLKTLDRWDRYVKQLRLPDYLSDDRRKAGRRHEPWITETRQKLKRLGIPKTVGRDLLLALGLSKERKDQRSDLSR